MTELTATGSDSVLHGELRSQLALLADLRQQIGSASGTALAALRNDVSAATGSASAIVQQARAAASAAGNAANDKPMNAQQARQAIEAVGRDLFERRVLDPYLQFRNAEDEAAYRKREQENAEALKRALALHTPEGDRRATEITLSQLADAKAHGADRSPDFDRLSGEAAAAQASLVAAKPKAVVRANSTKIQVAAPAEATPTDRDISDVAKLLSETGITNSTSESQPSGHGLAAKSTAAVSRAASATPG